MKMEMEVRKRHKTLLTERLADNELPLSLIESEILPRLPAKSVGRCMCVCKQWKSFLSTPAFAGMHLHHGTINDYKLLLLDHDHTFRTFDGSTTTNINNINNPDPDPSPSDDDQFIILASLDGLVCLASREEVVPTKLAFWNPLTGAYRKLPSMPGLIRFSLIYDAMGFYIDSSGDYKLVCLGTGSGAYVYSLRLDSWREIEFSVGSNIGCCNWSPPIFYGQCLYFNVTYMLEGYRWILCFDVNTETFRRMPFPPHPEGSRNYYGSLVVFNGCIQLCVSYTFEGTYHVILQQSRWRMDDGGWAKVAGPNRAVYKINEFTRQGICITSTRDNWLAVMEENNSFRKMNTEDFTSHYWYLSPPGWEYRASRMIYVETLVSPN